MTTDSETSLDDSPFTPPAVPWAAAAVDLVFSQESRPVANHSVRSWAFGRMFRDHLKLNAEVADSALFAATLLHDIGLRRDAREPVRFEIDGADRAAEFLTAQGLGAVEVDKVWEAIALHTSPGLPERRGPLAMLVRAGAGIDLGYFTEFVTDEQAAAIHLAYPRLALGRSIVDDIVAQVREVPERGPQFSIGAVLAHERSTPPHLAQLELDTAASRWGE
jgi:HD domain